MKRVVIMLLLFFLFTNIYPSFSQHSKIKRFTYGLNDYIFNTDGTYVQTIDEMILSIPNQYCPQYLVDSGEYSIRRGYYILNSAEKFDSMRRYNIKSSYQNNDSLIIEFFSPYEQIIKRNMNYAIYTYNIQILCDSSGIGRIFENDFNEKHRFCQSGSIYVPKPKNVCIREISITIYPNNVFYQYFTSFSLDPVVRIKHISENNDNLFFVNMPYFEYLSLTYGRREMYIIKKNNHRILCTGTYFRRQHPDRFFRRNHPYRFFRYNTAKK